MGSIGMYGGSFNPIHNGHIMVAKTVIEKLDLSCLLLMPTCIPPHKSSKEYATVEHRVNMCRLAAQDLEKTEVSLIEAKRQGVSYTFDTLGELKEIYSNDDIYLITGADMFLTIEKWYNAKGIFKLAKICTIPRGDAEIDRLNTHAKYLEEMGAKCQIIDVPKVDISSTEIRQRVKNGESISDMVCPRIEKYIAENGIYKDF